MYVFISWLGLQVQLGSAALCPQAWLPRQRPFVRHRPLKMSDCFQRVRSGSLPSFPFSFFNPSRLCPSCKLPLSPWGWRRAVSLFPSQTSVSINSPAPSPPPCGPRLWGGSALFTQRGSVSLLLRVGRCGMAAALDAGSPGQAAQCSSFSGAGGVAVQFSLCFASWVALGCLTSLRPRFLFCKVGVQIVPPFRSDDGR